MRKLIFLLTLFTVFLPGGIQSQNIYFPGKGEKWQTKLPGEFDIDGHQLEKAIHFAKENEYSGEKDLRIAILKGFSHEPFHIIAGPVKKRGGPAGLILKNGYIIGKWGDLSRVDMTFSVTKSYLSAVAGLAWDKGLITNVNDKVGSYVWDNTFLGEHNGKITWEHLLNQSSDWSGELFGMYDWADRPPTEGGIDDWRFRKLNEPGTFFKYNDVRVNVLSYSLLQVWRQPLPLVLKEEIMDRIDASTTWRWFGYDHAWINIDGLKVKSVTGGGHSGGGIFINTLDHARFGLLFMNNGKWKDKQLISKDWIRLATTSSPANESYGYLWWLNKGARNIEGVPNHIFYAAGFGGNYIVVDQINNIVIVTRWLEPSKMGQMVKLVYEALK